MRVLRGQSQKDFASFQYKIFSSKVIMKSIKHLNEMAKTLIAKNFPEVMIWNSHLYSDRVGVSLCNKCKTIGNQRLGHLKTVPVFSLFSCFSLSLRNLYQQSWPCKEELYDFDLGLICTDRLKHLGEENNNGVIRPLGGQVASWTFLFETSDTAAAESCVQQNTLKSKPRIRKQKEDCHWWRE